MEIDSSTVAFVTGANRGLGREFVLELLARGAKVYAGARDPGSVTTPGVTPVRIDVTDPASVAAAAELASDVTLLVNNAGTSHGQALIGGDETAIRSEMETHYFGTLSMTRAFAPVLARNGGGAVLNVLSVLAWITYVQTGAYSAAKSAAWAQTNAVRLELAPQGTLVTALHVGYMDTDMTKGVDAPKTAPAEVAVQALDGVAKGEFEVLADGISRQVRSGLSAPLVALYPELSDEIAG